MDVYVGQPEHTRPLLRKGGKGGSIRSIRVMVGRLDRGALAWYGREERWVADPSSDYLDPKRNRIRP